VLDPEGPIREADIGQTFPEVRLVQNGSSTHSLRF